MAPDVESTAIEEPVDSQAVQARFNPWWILGAILVVLAVVLGVRTLRKASDDLADAITTDDLIPGDEPPAG
jgi:small-conductance mechanosensitive channel